MVIIHSTTRMKPRRYRNGYLFTGAALSLFAPPPLISSKEIGLSGARAHKWLASVHLSAMIATQYYKERDKALHRASAYTAFGAYAAATVVIRFKQ
jgi:hypothetical protein